MEQERENKKGNTVLLTVIAVATLLVAVIGATFAYFSVTITGNDNATSVIVKTATLGISYDSGQAINEPNIRPNWSDSKTFTVENTGDVAMTYKIVWTNVSNDFADKTQLLYKVDGTVTDGTGTTKSLSQTQAPAANGDILTNITIEPGAEHSFVLTISFPDTGSEQNANQGKTFMGKIEVVADTVSE